LFASETLPKSKAAEGTRNQKRGEERREEREEEREVLGEEGIL
jgi:hypothetical protein